MPRDKPLRSSERFQGREYCRFARRAWLRSEGFQHDGFDGKPVVKRGVWSAGGFSLEFFKPTAATPELLRHRGRGIMMKGAGPKRAPGFPEWGQIPMPPKLLGEGVQDLMRISDARTSGTSFGTAVLHVAPESAIAAVQAGELERRCDLLKKAADDPR